MVSARQFLMLCTLALLLVPMVAWAITRAECTQNYNACTANCRAMPDPKLRAACWPACMAVYAGCLAVAN